MARLQLPATLAFVVIAAASASCDDDSKPPSPVSDASVCSFYCIPEQFYDDGGTIGEGEVTCPMCAQGGSLECPMNCRPVG